MIKILDRKVALTFLTVLVGSAVAILALFIVVDLIENLDKFIDKKAPWQAPVLYYLYYAPYILVLTLPVQMLLAAISTIGGMVRDNELVALKASGVSAYRPIATLGAIALIVTGLSFAISESVVPVTNEKKQDVMDRYVNQQAAAAGNERVNRALDLGSGQVLYVREYNRDRQVADQITIARLQGVEVSELIQAQRMRYLGGDRWMLMDVTERTFAGDRETFQRLPEKETVLAAVTPEELAIRTRDPEEMGYPELKAYVERGEARGRDVRRARVDLHMKTALPFANFIIVLFGAALAAARRRTGLAVGFTASILICFVYYVVLRSGQALGYNGDLEPLLAAWAGNIIFGTLSLWFLWRARF